LDQYIVVYGSLFSLVVVIALLVWLVFDLHNRVMARDFGDYVLAKQKPQHKAVVAKPEEVESREIETLNQIL